MEGDVDATAYVVDQPYLASLSEALPTDVGSQPDTSVMAQPLLTPDATVLPTAFLTLPANLARVQPEAAPIVNADPGNGSSPPPQHPPPLPPLPPSSPPLNPPSDSVVFSMLSTPIPTLVGSSDPPIEIFNSGSTLSSTVQEITTLTDQRTLTTEQNIMPGQTGLTSSTTPSSSPSSSPNTSQTKAIAGGASGASLIIILGAIVFCILRRKRRYRAARSASSHEVPTSSDIPGQSLPQSAQLSATPQPFLDFRLMQNQPSSKGILTGHASLLTRNNQGDIEQAADPFKDPVPAAGSLSNNDDEVQRVRDTLDRLQALTSRFEREVQQLGVLAKSGQLSAEDRLRLEEIRRTTGLKIPWDSSDDRFSMARSSSGSSSSPPSYHTHGS